MMAGESRQQEVEAAGHAIPIIGRPSESDEHMLLSVPVPGI